VSGDGCKISLSQRLTSDVGKLGRLRDSVRSEQINEDDFEMAKVVVVSCWNEYLGLVVDRPVR
jgi:hypothetical protein